VRSLFSGGITDRSASPTHLGAEGTSHTVTAPCVSLLGECYFSCVCFSPHSPSKQQHSSTRVGVPPGLRPRSRTGSQGLPASG